MANLEADIAALEKLAAELTARGFETRLAVPQGHVPSFHAGCLANRAVASFGAVPPAPRS